MADNDEDWADHVIVRSTAPLGMGGGCVFVGSMVVLWLLDLVEARNERVWALVMTVGGLGVVAVAVAWMGFIIGAVLGWLRPRS